MNVVNKSSEKNVVNKTKQNAKDPEKQKEMLLNKRSCWFMGCGAVTVLIGGISAIFWPAVFFSQLKKMMVLTNTSMSFGIWREIPIPMYMEFFMLNITNVDEILAGKNVSIRVTQMGPYVYREQHTKPVAVYALATRLLLDMGLPQMKGLSYFPRLADGLERVLIVCQSFPSLDVLLNLHSYTLVGFYDTSVRMREVLFYSAGNHTANIYRVLTKVDIEFNDNSTVTFYNERFWHFEPEMSNGSLSDMVTSLNPVVATIAYFMRNQPAVLRVSADVMMRMYHEHMFITANVSDWLFDGLNDPLLEAVNKLPIKLPIPFDKFGWFYARNGSKEYDGLFVMNTGAKDFSRLGMVEMWKHSNRTLYRDECGEVRGSTGELWAPELGQPEVEVFAPDICTYMILTKNKTMEHDGIEGVEYNAGAAVFDNGYNDPRTACYCDEVRDRDCLPSGTLNVSSCRFGAPAFVSLPHFLHTDPHYPSKVEGLDPKEDYNFRLALEMFTGIPLMVAAQLQINLLVRYVPGMSLINILPQDDVLIPMFWFRQEVRMTPDYAKLARMALNIRYITPYAFYAITALGLGLLLAGIVILIRRLLKAPDTMPILEDESSETQ